MTTIHVLHEKRAEIMAVAGRHGTGNVRIFGSISRGDNRPESDVDLLVDVIGPTPPWFPGGLQADLEDLLGRKVDLVLSRSLSPVIRDTVMRDAIPLS